MENNPIQIPKRLRLLDKYIVFLLLGVGLFFSFNISKGKKYYGVVWSDAEGYYLYLPATFIYGGFKQYDGHDGIFMTSCCHITKEGFIQDRYPYGVSVLEAPFFLVAHFIAKTFYGKGADPPEKWKPEGEEPPLGYKREYNPERGYATGFSSIYLRSISFAGIFYFCLGFWFLKEILKRLFSLPVALFTSVAIVFGTNVFYYAFREAGMSHIYSFFLFSFFLYQLPSFLKDPQVVKTIILGLTFGLICFTRPTNILIALSFFLWEVYSFQDFSVRVKGLIRQWKYFIIMLICFSVVSIPQLIFYKIQYGVFTPYTYGNETFNFLHPEYFKVLFSHQNGFFMYAPMLLLIIPGLYFCFKWKKGSPILVLSTFLIATWIFASWWAWWFGGAYGHRCYVEYMPLLAIPFAFLMEKIFYMKRRMVKVLYSLVLIFFIHANIKMSYLYTVSKYPWDGSQWTSEKYWKQWDKVVQFGTHWP